MKGFKIFITLKLLFKNGYFLVGFVTFSFLVFLGFLGPIIWSGSIESGQFKSYQAPSNEHWLGTDAQGRELFTVLIVGIGQSLTIGFLGGTLAFLIGFIVGLVAGYNTGILGDALTSITNVFLLIPSWPLLVIVASSVFRVTIPIMATVVGLFSWPWSSRRIRAQVKSLREQGFIDLAKLNGENDLGICFKEIMPNMLSYLSVTWIGLFSWTIINEVGLEVIGLGPQGTSTLGLMIFWCNWSGGMAIGMWWWIVPPVLCIILIFMSLQFLVVGLDWIFNPRLKR